MKLSFLSLLGMMVIVAAEPSFAKCSGSPFNPVTDVPWNAIFPVRVGGVAVQQARDLPDTNEGRSGSPVCSCTTGKETYLGVRVSFFELATLVETTGDPYCSPAVGTAFSSMDTGYHGGTNNQLRDQGRTFKQLHWIKFPVFKILGLLSDSKCMDTSSGFDYANFSELDPTHNKDYIAAIFDPRVFLFAAPVFDLACVPSRMIALVPGEILTPAFNSLFWCCFGNVYPLTGARNWPNELEASAAVAAKELYKFASTGLNMDLTSDVCKPTPRFLWKKGDYRWALSKPVRMSRPIICDTPEVVWGSGKNPPFREGNFLWLLFQKRQCCQKIKGSA